MGKMRRGLWRSASREARHYESMVVEREMMSFAMNEGLYLSFFSNVIRLTPPLNISEDDLITGLAILDRTLDIADRECL